MGDRILLVEDSNSMRTILSSVLSNKGYEVYTASNGREGLDQLNDIDDLNLVVTDLNMPVMNGIDFIKHIRESSRNRFVPIIVLSTESDQERISEGKAAGASAWIFKPFTPDKLLALIEKFISC